MSDSYINYINPEVSPYQYDMVDVGLNWQLLQVEQWKKYWRQCLEVDNLPSDNFRKADGSSVDSLTNRCRYGHVYKIIWRPSAVCFRGIGTRYFLLAVPATVVSFVGCSIVSILFFFSSPVYLLCKDNDLSHLYRMLNSKVYTEADQFGQILRVFNATDTAPRRWLFSDEHENQLKQKLGNNSYNKSNVYYIKLGDCKVRNINQIGVTDTISPIEYIVCYKDNDKIFLLENNWVDFNQSPLKQRIINQASEYRETCKKAVVNNLSNGFLQIISYCLSSFASIK